MLLWKRKSPEFSFRLLCALGVSRPLESRLAHNRKVSIGAAESRSETKRKPLARLVTCEVFGSTPSFGAAFFSFTLGMLRNRETQKQLTRISYFPAYSIYVTRRKAASPSLLRESWFFSNFLRVAFFWSSRSPRKKALGYLSKLNEEKKEEKRSPETML